MKATTSSPLSKECETLGQRINRLRNAKHMTIQDLAGASRLSSFTVADTMYDRFDSPKLRTVLNLARALDVSLDDLLEGVELS